MGYIVRMGVTSITISLRTLNGRYRDILEVATELSGRHGSATNAIAEMVRESPSYRQAKQRLDKRNKVPRGTETGGGVDLVADVPAGG